MYLFQMILKLFSMSQKGVRYDIFTYVILSCRTYSFVSRFLYVNVMSCNNLFISDIFNMSNQRLTTGALLVKFEISLSRIGNFGFFYRDIYVEIRQKKRHYKSLYVFIVQ